MKQFKFLLLNPPFKEPIIRDNYCCFTSKSGYIWPPIDFLYLSAILNHKKIKLSVINAVVEKMSWESVLIKIKKIKPDFIIVLTGTASFKEDIPPLKLFKDKDIFLMGNIASFKTVEIMKEYPFVRGVIHNFYDSSIKDFFLKDKLSKSITLRKNGKIIEGKVNVFKPLSTVKLNGIPQYNLFPLYKYETPFIIKKPMVTTMTSFGCPFSCKFCIASSLIYYFRDLDELKKEFDEMKKRGIREIFFEDSTFNSYSQYTEKVLNLLIKNKYHFSWSANIHSFNVSEELFSLMKKAGCHTLQIGVESGDEETLKKNSPSKKIENIKKAFKIAKKVGIKTLGYFIIGFPEETKKTAEKTINFALELNPNYASFSVLTPDYGTALYEELVKKGKISDKKLYTFDSSDEPFINNPRFNLKDQEKYIKKAYSRFYLNPKRLLSYILDFKRIKLYLKNGYRLILKKILR